MLQWLGPPQENAPDGQASLPVPPIPPEAAGETAAAQTQLASYGPPSPELPRQSTPAAPAAPKPGAPVVAPVAAMMDPVVAGAPAGLPRIAADGRMPMQIYAAGFDPDDRRPRVAVMLGGIGLSETDSDDAVRLLPAAISFVVSPYSTRPERLLADVRAHGHEYLVSLPMEPQGFPIDDPGNQALLTAASAAQNAKRLDWALSANALVITVPPLTTASAAGAGTAVDVLVTDLGTGGTSRMTQALTYGGAQGGLTMRLVSAPRRPARWGTAMGSPFTVQILGQDGSGGGTAAAGERVTFAAVSGTVSFGPCAAATCVVVTDAQGMASVTVTPQTTGTVQLRANDGSGAGATQTVSFTAQSAVGSIAVLSAPTGAQPATVTSGTAFAVKVVGPDGTTGLGGRAVVFSVTSGVATFGGCFSTPCTVMTDGNGVASVTVTPGAEGAITLMAASGGAQKTVNFTGSSNQDVLRVLRTPTAKVFVGDNAGKFGVQLLRVDGTTPEYSKPIVFTSDDGLVVAESGLPNGVQSTQDTSGQGYTEVTLLTTRKGIFTATGKL